jgi:glycine hydroxymethyltransferase
MRRIGGWMLAVLRAPDDEPISRRIRGEISELCRHFPVPAARLPADSAAGGTSI